jgi:hypothetical protein
VHARRNSWSEFHQICRTITAAIPKKWWARISAFPQSERDDDVWCIRSGATAAANAGYSTARKTVEPA